MIHDHKKPSEYVRAGLSDKAGFEQLADMLDRILKILDRQDMIIRVHQMRLDGVPAKEINKFIASRTGTEEEDSDA